MGNLEGFDARTVEPNFGFDPVPAGRYFACIVGTEEKPTKAGTGSYVEICFEISGGEYDGRRLWTRLNLDNPNPTAVKFARAELSAICRAINVLTPHDSADLEDHFLLIDVALIKRKDTGELTNEVKGYAVGETLVASTPMSDDNPLDDTGPSRPLPPPPTPPWKRG